MKRLLLLEPSEAEALETVLGTIDPNTLAPELDTDMETVVDICANILTVYMQLKGRIGTEQLMCKDCESTNIGYDGSVEEPDETKDWEPGRFNDMIGK